MRHSPDKDAEEAEMLSAEVEGGGCVSLEGRGCVSLEGRRCVSLVFLGGLCRGFPVKPINVSVIIRYEISHAYITGRVNN